MKRKFCLNLRKRKVKTKMLLKITRVDEYEASVQLSGRARAVQI